MRRAGWLLGGVLALLLATACSTTRVTSAWPSPTGKATAAGLHKVLVVGASSNESARRHFEQELAREWAKSQAGLEVVPSYLLIERGADLNRDSVRRVATAQGFDGVLVALYTGMDLETQQVPDLTYYEYLEQGTPRPEPQSHTEVTERVRIETRLFDVRAPGTVLWAASSRTLRPSSADQAAEDVARALVRKLREDLGR